MSELFDCSLDYLLRDSPEAYGKNKTDSAMEFPGKRLWERKSGKSIWNMPLWHIGRNARGFFAVGLNARGVIAIGLKARGIVSLGFLSAGLLSFGMLSLGLLSLGMLALGFLSAGCFSIGIFAAGAISFGIISLGAIAMGDFSVGALAIGKYFAWGDNARAMIAIGDTRAAGSLFQKAGEISAQDSAAIKALLNANVPAILSWATKILATFLP